MKKTCRPKILKVLTFVVAAVVLCVPSAQGGKKHEKEDSAKGEITANAKPVLWQEPTDLATRNLFYGSGGKEHEPAGPFTFVEEDKHGSNPKFIVQDANNVKWTVKMGEEARPETVASRLVWAVGYFVTDDYFMTALPVENMSKLHRGESRVDPIGQVYDVRLKAHGKGEKKLGEWKWADNPFVGTREFNGLRVMMALINNWDLKDVNNAIYFQKNPPEKIYLISDLGASFGTSGLDRTREKSKGNLESFAHSKFIRSEHSDRIDFEVPNRPAMIVAGANPHQFLHRVKLEWIGKDIPRDDVRWIGQLLSRLSHEQIRDAFRAGGYPPDELEAFAQIIEARIAELYTM
ncbi:MAG TPA: hypothetical protein VKU01_30530 [Bryobacteraceae bacterium]|nr:hypothetical protein [Bryobacteraceae bacterium]